MSGSYPSGREGCVAYDSQVHTSSSGTSSLECAETAPAESPTPPPTRADGNSWRDASDVADRRDNKEDTLSERVRGRSSAETTSTAGIQPLRGVDGCPEALRYEEKIRIILWNCESAFKLMPSSSFKSIDAVVLVETWTTEPLDLEEPRVPPHSGPAAAKNISPLFW